MATKAINRITPKWSLLLGSVTVSAVLAMIALATNVYLWIVANVLNGVVLSFGAHAAASGVVARFYGRRTQAAYGFVAGGYYVLTALEVFLVAFLLSVADYRTVLWTFSGLSLAVGLFSNLVLIGRVPAGPRRRATTRSTAASRCARRCARRRSTCCAPSSSWERGRLTGRARSPRCSSPRMACRTPMRPRFWACTR